MLEYDIQKTIVDYINSLPGCIAENMHGNAFQAGRPDINACVQGQTVRIEVKRPPQASDKGKRYGLTDTQNQNMLKWARNGCRCFVAESITDVKKVLYLDDLCVARLKRCDSLYCKWCFDETCDKSFLGREL